MRHHNSKLENANVIAEFESQDNAEEALLVLRSVGFKDGQIGYYCPIADGVMTDTLARYHRFAGSVIGTVIGAVIGWALARWAYSAGQDLDPFGLAFTCSVFCAFFLGTVGGMMGLWISDYDANAPIPPEATETYLMSVNAGNARNEASLILRQHGGHELHTQGLKVPAHV
jgi:hypothetical protein